MRDKWFWIEKLEMIKHPEGGYYRSFYDCPIKIKAESIGEEFKGERALSSSIYFLIDSEDASNFHRLKADEIWYYHEGAPLTVAVITPEGQLKYHQLGLEFEKGQRPQVLVPAGCIFGSFVEQDYALVSCMVSYGFDYEDFELFERETLLNAYPEHEEIVKKLTRG
ncbi:MAG: cupin domain-containing protein [Clostridia bacterium]|nr:cupin domain-containing protein [Clostridia bacterium]